MPDAVVHDPRAGVAFDDRSFDQLYPAWARKLSTIHWTPIDVACRAAELLVSRPGARVLDVGAGVGKFALVGAMHTRGHFSGIEQRFHFVRTARDVATVLGLHDVQFHHGNMVDLDWSAYEGFYLYNPFGENLRWLIDSMDETVDLDESLYHHYARVVKAKLAEAAVGTRVVTYHGFGADTIPGFRLELRERWRSDELHLWIKD